MRIEDVGYEFEGTTMVGRLAVDEYRTGPRPSVLLCHEGPGLDEHMKGRAVNWHPSGISRLPSTIREAVS